MNYLKALNKHFGYSEFRGRQLDAINAISEGKDVLYVESTGAGKSLAYQLPAIAKNGTAIVFTPLISLMQDQVRDLTSKGIPCAYVNHTLDESDKGQALSAMVGGKLRLVYMSPEALKNPSIRSAIMQTKLDYVAVDEAHTIGLWGNGFRPYFSRLSHVLKDEIGLGKTPVIATTATASSVSRDIIVANLKIEGCEKVIGETSRKNIRLSVERTEDKQAALLRHIEANPLERGARIVYCGTRKEVEGVAHRLSREGLDVRAYHGGMSAADRMEAHEHFAQEVSPLLVATNAFGMGIDRADVREVVHYQMPGSLEAYAQEIGRAGRDGEQSNALLLFSKSDVSLQNFFIKASYPSEEKLVSAYQLVSNWPSPVFAMKASELAMAVGVKTSRQEALAIVSMFESQGIWEVKQGVNDGYVECYIAENLPDFKPELVQSYRKADQDALDKMTQYCIDDASCKKVSLDSYFDDKREHKDCGQCSACLKQDLTVDLSSAAGVAKALRSAIVLAQSLELSYFNRLKGGFKKDDLSKVLSGIPLSDVDYSKTEGFGLLKDLPYHTVSRFVERLTFSRVLLDKGAVVALGEVAKGVISGSRPANTVIEALRESAAKASVTHEAKLDLLRKARATVAKQVGRSAFLIASEKSLKAAANSEDTKASLVKAGVKEDIASLIDDEFNKKNQKPKLPDVPF